MVIPQTADIQAGTLRCFRQQKFLPEIQNPAVRFFAGCNPLAADLVLRQHTGHTGGYVRFGFFPAFVPDHDGQGQLYAAGQFFSGVGKALLGLFHPAAVPEKRFPFHHHPAGALAVALLRGRGRPAEHGLFRIHRAVPASFPDPAAVNKNRCDFQHMYILPVKRRSKKYTDLSLTSSLIFLT